MDLAKRARTVLRRQRNAKRIGVNFRRAKDFSVPPSIALDGRKIALDVPSEVGQNTAFVEIFLDDCYHLRQLAKLADIASILDVGANVGLFSLAARAAFPQCRIHAYEPNMALTSHLASQARQARFDFFQEAVGREAGMASLLVDPHQSVLTSTRTDCAGTIPQVAFKTALNRLGDRIDLVKLDCEGAEWEILEDKASWQRVRFISMEYHLGPNDKHERIARVLHAIGYQVHYHCPDPASDFGLVFAERLQ